MDFEILQSNNVTTVGKGCRFFRFISFSFSIPTIAEGAGV